MSREIKFRAWGVFKPHFGNPVYEMTTDVFVNDGDCYVYEQEFGASISSPSFLKKKNVDLMQFTGLKDKNDNDIYEGDIVKGEWVERDKKTIQQFVVNMDKGCIFPFTEETGLSSGSLYSTKMNAWDFEIIGNIHQNKDLLK